VKRETDRVEYSTSQGKGHHCSFLLITVLSPQCRGCERGVDRLLGVGGLLLHADVTGQDEAKDGHICQSLVVEVVPSVLVASTEENLVAMWGLCCGLREMDVRSPAYTACISLHMLPSRYTYKER
jgi:hypothetical protein